MTGICRDVTRWRVLNPGPFLPEIAEQYDNVFRELDRVPLELDALVHEIASLEAAWGRLNIVVVDHHDSERAAYLHWLELRAREHGETWAVAASTSPGSPIGPNEPERQAWAWIRKHADAPFPVGRDCPELQAGMPAQSLRVLMPLDGAEYAFGVEAVGERGGALLFMGKPVQRRHFDTSVIGEQVVWVPDGSRIEVVPVPQRSIPTATLKEARQRWRESNGLPVKAGRHPGATHWRPGKIVSTLLAYIDAHGHAPRSREAFVAWAYDVEEFAFTVGSEKVTGDRWDKLVGVPLISLARNITGDMPAVWLVDETSDTEGHDPPT